MRVRLPSTVRRPRWVRNINFEHCNEMHLIICPKRLYEMKHTSRLNVIHRKGCIVPNVS